MSPLPLVVAGTLVTWHPRIDVEPAAWVLDGYSVHVGVTPERFPRLVVSAGAYAFDVPRPLVDLGSGNQGEPWDVRLYLGYGVFADYFVAAAPDHGWVVGAQLGAQHLQASIGDRSFRWVDALAMVRAGYEWHPWGHGGYLFPWVGAAFTPEVSGDHGFYDTVPVQPYVAIDLGWRLE